MQRCNFDIFWVGKCGNAVIAGSQFCEKHAVLKCDSCGKQAGHDCGETMGGLVCGTALCGDCEHEIAADGTNGFTVKHCKKSEQKFLPWYMRPDPAAKAAEGGK